MPATASETFYDLALRALEEQEREVSSLRSRTGTLVAAAAVAATLLGREVFADAHPDGFVEWVACGTGLAALGVVLGASTHLLRSHDLEFSIDAAAMIEEAERREARSRTPLSSTSASPISCPRPRRTTDRRSAGSSSPSRSRSGA